MFCEPGCWADAYELTAVGTEEVGLVQVDSSVGGCLHVEEISESDILYKRKHTTHQGAIRVRHRDLRGNIDVPGLLQCTNSFGTSRLYIERLSIKNG